MHPDASQCAESEVQINTLRRCKPIRRPSGIMRPGGIALKGGIIIRNIFSNNNIIA